MLPTTEEENPDLGLISVSAIALNRQGSREEKVEQARRAPTTCENLLSVNKVAPSAAVWERYRIHKCCTVGPGAPALLFFVNPVSVRAQHLQCS